MTNEQIQRIYNTKMQNIMTKNKRREQEQDDADRLAFQKKQETEGKLTLLLQGLNIGQTQGEKVQAKLLAETYEGVGGTLPPKYKFKPPTKLLDIPEKIKRFVDPKSALELRPEYIEYGESLKPEVPIDMEDDFYVPGQDASTSPQVDFQSEYEDYLKQASSETKRITEFDPMSDVDLDVSPELEGAPDIMMESPQLKGAEGAPITDVEIPDAKPGGKFVGKTLGALQTLQTMQGIGKTLTDEEASGADKAIAGTQAAKMLADMAAKKAGQETAAQIGSKAATQFIKGKGLQGGVKLGGKAAVGAAAGGVIGGYTAVTGAKEAGEAWKEKDYDEAILHGISSASGGLQTAGAGMMLTGVGAPIGAVLYGIGAAGSVISSAGLMLEGLFGGGGSAPVIPEAPKFNASRYLDSIRKQREYAY